MPCHGHMLSLSHPERHGKLENVAVDLGLGLDWSKIESLEQIPEGFEVFGPAPLLRLPHASLSLGGTIWCHVQDSPNNAMIRLETANNLWSKNLAFDRSTGDC